MIVDLLAGVLLALWETLIGLLPDVTPPTFSGISAVAAKVGEIDSVFPILGIVQLVLGLLAAVLVFIVIRLVLVVVNIVWW